MTLPLPSVPGRGPAFPSIVIVAECATADDIWKGYPLAGNLGTMFAKFLHEAKIILSSCYVTNAWKTRPLGDSTRYLYSTTKSTAQKTGLTEVLHGTWVHPSVPAAVAALQAEVLSRKPKVILALGDFAMFALTGITGSVDTWRGSHLEFLLDPSITVIPTYAPSYVQRMWQVKSFCVRDLQRAHDIALHPEYFQYPAYDFIIRPTFAQVRDTLARLLTHVSSGHSLPLSCDVETIARHLSCIGIAWSSREALCIPFMTLDGHYWTEEEEIELSFLLRSLLTHPLTEVIGQNFQYDAQYFVRFLGYCPNLTFDTMLAQHTIFPGIPKALDFLSSMYCHWHRFWKGELNDYSRLPENMAIYWTYNCKDCCITFEVSLALQELLRYLRLESQYAFQMKMNTHVITTMLRGVRVDTTRRSELAGELFQAIADHDAILQLILERPLNTASAKQMKELFYDDFQLPVQFNRKTKQPSLDNKALQALVKKEPLIKPLVDLILKKRSLGVYFSTFIQAPLSRDKRLRTQYNVAGTETFRLSSSTDAFGEGLNMQNISSGKEE